MKKLRYSVLLCISFTVMQVIISQQHVWSAEEQDAVKKMFDAVEKDNTEMLGKLLQEHSSIINAQDKNGYTALIKAASNGQINMVNFLLEAHPNINIKNIHGNTALMRASSSGHAKIITSLIVAGADKTLKNNDNRTARALAPDTKKYDEAVKAAIGYLSEKKKIISEYLIPDLAQMVSDYAYSPQNIDLPLSKRKNSWDW